MAKIAIVFCLIIAAVYGASIPPPSDVGILDSVIDKVNEYKDEVKKVVENAIRSVEDKIDEIKRSAGDIVDDLRKKAKEFSEDAVREIEKVVKELDLKIDEITGRAPGVDVTECTEMAKGIHDTAKGIVTDVTGCVSTKVDETVSYVENIFNIAANLVKDLYNISAEAVRCTQSGKNGMQIFGCVAGALKEAYELANKQAPAVIKQALNVVDFAHSAVKDLAKCSINKSVPVFVDSIDVLVPRIESCVNQKIAEAKNQ